MQSSFLGVWFILASKIYLQTSHLLYLLIQVMVPPEEESLQTTTLPHREYIQRHSGITRILFASSFQAWITTSGHCDCIMTKQGGKLFTVTDSTSQASQ